MRIAAIAFFLLIAVIAYKLRTPEPPQTYNAPALEEACSLMPQEFLEEMLMKHSDWSMGQIITFYIENKDDIDKRYK